MAKNLSFFLICYLLSVAVCTYGESHKITAARKVKYFFCVAQIDAPADKLQGFLDYACGGQVDCSALQPGGPCFEPNTLVAHASYALDLFWYRTFKCPQDIGIIITKDPSHGACDYP